MLMVRPDPVSISLSILAQKPDGTAKTDIVSGSVRVYHVTDAGAEVEDLTATPLVQVGTTSVWRYLWEPASLSEGSYIVEYTLTDALALVGLATEDLNVSDYATQGAQAVMAGKVHAIYKIELGHWKIVDNQMIYYELDGSTPYLIYDLFDASGNPSMTKVFERVPA